MGRLFDGHKKAVRHPLADLRVYWPYRRIGQEVRLHPLRPRDTGLI